MSRPALENTDASPRGRLEALEARQDRTETALAELAGLMSRVGPGNLAQFCPTLAQVVADVRRRSAETPTETRPA